MQTERGSQGGPWLIFSGIVTLSYSSRLNSDAEYLRSLVTDPLLATYAIETANNVSICSMALGVLAGAQLVMGGSLIAKRNHTDNLQ